ncbi:MAG: Calx-beta domain-containing protein [Clostridia bacterium]|nr:Calx-beta domain-containing protein [Clostridia bacterium]
MKKNAVVILTFAVVLAICAVSIGIVAADDYFSIGFESDSDGAIFTISRESAVSESIVYYRTEDGSAVQDVNYSAVNGYLKFDVGETEKTVYVWESRLATDINLSTKADDIAPFICTDDSERCYFFRIWNDSSSSIMKRQSRPPRFPRSISPRTTWTADTPLLLPMGTGYNSAIRVTIVLQRSI